MATFEVVAVELRRWWVASEPAELPGADEEADPVPARRYIVNGEWWPMVADADGRMVAVGPRELALLEDEGFDLVQPCESFTLPLGKLGEGPALAELVTMAAAVLTVKSQEMGKLWAGAVATSGVQVTDEALAFREGR